MEENNLEEELDLSVEWQLVKDLASGNEPAFWAMAVIEAEKVFRETLSLVSFGNNTKERIKQAQKVFHDLDHLLDARELHRRITTEAGFLPTQEETTRSLEAYFQAILDLTSLDHPVVSSWQRFQNTLLLRFGRLGRYLRAALITVVLFFALVWFLADTAWGKQVSGFVVELTHWVLHYLGFIVLAVVGIAFIIFLSFIYFDQRRGRD